MASSSSSSKTHSQGQSSSFPTFKDRGPSKSPTHFLCLPLHGSYYQTLPPAHSSLKTALKQFTIDETNPETGLDEKFIIPPDAIRPFDTLHLTLGVMTLSTEEEIENAISTLKNLDLSQFLPPPVSGEDKKLYVDLKGLEPFLNSKSGVTGCRVVFLPPKDASSSSQTRLLQFSEALRSHLIEKGILTSENRQLKLHATVINTVYCKRIKPALDSRNTGKRDRNTRSNKTGRVEFDATEILEKHKDHVWAEGLEIDRVQICKMGAKKGREVVMDDGMVEVVGGGYESIVDKLME
ncbi:uncharacterized protein DFL_005318 [Arthrobotrys flagrans]|uniref:A-kinase anchor protein 7-like phosphoesterase domain-containing protein n=1 Tax=Arthrobotrys flagrans TaxID=97331 RepID=A0A437A7D6_ARTFL|nr:hypothetical protein DFL_005318 [Arthrobotrys flagrans]